jgi:uncharacterized protein YecE (DUF72 family)
MDTARCRFLRNRQAMAEIRIGVSGWSYKSWERSFYPPDLPRKRQLEYLTRRFDTVEVNSSFYSLKKPSVYAEWRETSPPGFVYAVKGSRFISHNKKLRDAEAPLANFLASGILALEDRLGPILWQLPASLRFDPDRIAGFVAMLPRDTEQLARLAKRHDHRVEGRSLLRPDRRRPVRHALEVRNETYFVPEFVQLLRKHRVALVPSDSPEWPLVEEVTADFVYARLHGSRKMYASRYTDRELDEWAERITAWAAGGERKGGRRIIDRAPPKRKSRDVYVYFDNDQEGHAPHDALRLAERLGVAVPAA